MKGADAGEPVIVLVRPQMGENIGAAARAMGNFGLGTLRLVAPRDGWPNPRAIAMASGAAAVLDGATLHDDVPSAVADLSVVYATTARPRDLAKPVLSPEAAMARARALVARGERVGILFGAERAGLENDDLIGAQAIVSVPVSADFPSLNLAQCVLLLAWEWRRAAGDVPAEVFEPGPAGMARQETVARFVAELSARLDAAGFFHPEDKRASLAANVANLFTRPGWTDAELRMLWGIVKALNRGG